MSEKKRFSIHDIRSLSHIRIAAQCTRQITQWKKHAVISGITSTTGRRHIKSRVTQNNIDPIGEVAHHISQPISRWRETCRIENNDIIVSDSFESQCYSQFPTTQCTSIGRDIGGIKTGIPLCIQIQNIPSFIGRSIIDHHDLEIGIILFEKFRQITT